LNKDHDDDNDCTLKTLYWDAKPHRRNTERSWC